MAVIKIFGESICKLINVFGKVIVPSSYQESRKGVLSRMDNVVNQPLRVVLDPCMSERSMVKTKMLHVVRNARWNRMSQ
jgi:hypothetical protein